MTDDAANINQYLNGLKPEIRDRMLLMKPASLADAEMNALLLEKSLKDSPETQLLNTIKTLTEEIRKEHAKVVDSAATADKVAFSSPQPSFAPRSPRPQRPYQAHSNNYRPPNPGRYNTNNSYQRNKQYSQQPRYQNNNNNWTDPAPGTRYQNPGYQNSYQSCYQRSQQQNRYQNTPQGQYEPQQQRNFNPFCRGCNTYHPFGQHTNQHNYPHQQQQMEHSLNTEGQTT